MIVPLAFVCKIGRIGPQMSLMPRKIQTTDDGQQTTDSKRPVVSGPSSVVAQILCVIRDICGPILFCKLFVF